MMHDGMQYDLIKALERRKFGHIQRLSREL